VVLPREPLFPAISPPRFESGIGLRQQSIDKYRFRKDFHSLLAFVPERLRLVLTKTYKDIGKREIEPCVDDAGPSRGCTRSRGEDSRPFEDEGRGPEPLTQKGACDCVGLPVIAGTPFKFAS
jgi:hypothetical protein